MRKGFDPGNAYACPYSAQLLGDDDSVAPGAVPAPMLKSKDRPQYYTADQADQGAGTKLGK